MKRKKWWAWPWLAILLLVLLLSVPASAAKVNETYYGTADLYSTKFPGETYPDSFFCQDAWFWKAEPGKGCIQAA